MSRARSDSRELRLSPAKARRIALVWPEILDLVAEIESSEWDSETLENALRHLRAIVKYAEGQVTP